MGDRHAGQHDPGEPEPALDPAPLILTVRLDPDAQAWFDRLRTLHFPPERNIVAAHVTLFHHLPPERAVPIAAELALIAGGTAPFAVTVAGLRSLGRGTAFRLESETLTHLRAILARRWAEHLTPQDRQGFRPHVTVQNKVTAEAARRLLADLSQAFQPFEAVATGLALWRYRGGPWDPAGAFPFTPPADPPARRHRSPWSGQS